jgi:hypothetical protein
VRINGDTAAVVDDSHAPIREQRDQDRVGVTRHRLVDGVVDDLLHQVVQSARSGRADVHAGALAHSLETLENLDLVGSVLALLLLLGGCGALGVGGAPGCRFRLVSRGFRRHQR